MLNVLKIDFYKAFRTVSFWVISFLNVFSVFFASFTQFSIYITALDNSSDFSDYILHSLVKPFFEFFPQFISQCTFLVGIFAVMFAVSEFSYGTIKNIASKGYRREFIYLSKFITALVVAIINILIAFATSFITAKVMINDRMPGFFDINNFWETVGKISLQLVAYLSIAIFLAMFCRSLGSSLAIFLAFVFLESSAAALINQFLRDVLKLEFNVDPYTIFGAFFDPSQTTRGVIVLFVYIAIATVVGIYTFKQRDIN